MFRRNFSKTFACVFTKSYRVSDSVTRFFLQTESFGIFSEYGAISIQRLIRGWILCENYLKSNKNHNLALFEEVVNNFNRPDIMISSSWWILYIREQKNMSLSRKSTLRGCYKLRKSSFWVFYKSRQITKQDLFPFINLQILDFEVTVSNMP